MKGKSLKITALVIVMALLLGIMAACTQEPADVEEPETNEETVVETEAEEPATEEPVDANTLPRDQTLYYAGLQYGAVNGWNPVSDDMNNALVLRQNAGGARTLMFETLYMYNMLDGELVPLIADGDYVWNDTMTEITVKIKADAKWSDGTPITAHDVAYTYYISEIAGNAQSSFDEYIEDVVAVDDSTVVIKAQLTEDGKAKNPLLLYSYLVQTYVLQEEWLKTLEARTTPETIKQDPGEDVVWSGPYTKFFADDQKVVLVRDDNYWGQADSMWGSLPVPKYIAHTIYSDNAASQTAFEAGEVDVAQVFIPDIQDLWLEKELPISTYLDEAPYGICVNMPTAYFNMNVPELAGSAALRKAIAMAVDYDSVIANAMTNQSPTFEQTPRSLMNPTAGEQAKFDHDAVKDLQWAGNDIEGANALLDEAGIVDTDGDGYREIDGVNLQFNACCPNGWTDWMAAMELVAAAGDKIGIEIVTEFPEWSVYQTVVTAATHSDYDIFMMWTDGSSPVQPWGRVRQLMSSEYVGVEGNWSGNWGHYTNDRVDELLAMIPTEADAAKVKEYYTEAVEIYLTDVPSFSLMYRPEQFHAVNETVWTSFPEATDGLNIPPMILCDGYGIAGLYNLELVGE